MGSTPAFPNDTDFGSRGGKVGNQINGVVLAIVVATPIAWLTSEFQSRRWVRLVLGMTSILLSFRVAAIVGYLQVFEANSWFGGASKTLINTTVSELEAGNQARVLKSLKGLQKKYVPTYEHRARYDILVEEAVKEMKSPDGKP